MLCVPRFGRLPAISKIAVPINLLTFYDLLSFEPLAKMDPMTYHIPRIGRIVLGEGKGLRL